MKDLQIFHPYGTVGNLLWQSTDNTGSSIQFGKTPTANELIESSKQIKTFTEGTDESLSEVNSIRSHIESSYRLVFLGFSFQKKNLDILAPLNDKRSYAARSLRHIYLTGKGISLDDRGHIIRNLKNRLGTHIGQFGESSINHVGYECNKLFEAYKIGLSFVTEI